MSKYIVKTTCVWNIEVEAKNEDEAWEKGEDIFVRKEQNGDLGAPDYFDTEIMTTIQE